MDELFLQQSYSKNEALKTQLGGELLEKFLQHAGPFDRTDHNKPFITGHAKPKGAGFYPDDLTKQAWNEWLAAHPEDEQTFESPYTIIRRDATGNLYATPYHAAYEEAVTKVATHLRQASMLTTNEKLKDYLDKRATAFLTDDYYESDLAWMDLDGALDVVIGPYEVYEDELNGLKTAYEGFIGLVDEDETKKLKHLETIAATLEADLPIQEAEHHERGKHSPIKIVNLLYSSGDGKAGIHFTAFNLPNDERVRQAKGSKKVLLRNVAQGKFNACWQPITQRLLNDEIRKHCTFDAYFTHILLHEISHGLGPGIITKDEKETTVNACLKETYPFLEEAKADILGVHNAFVLAKRGIFTDAAAMDILITFIAGIFRSIRLGINEAHGGANMVTYNELEDAGAVKIAEGQLVIDAAKTKEALTTLLEKILTIQGTGDYAAAKTLLETQNTIRPHIQTILESLADLPIDIKPIPPCTP